MPGSLPPSAPTKHFEIEGNRPVYLCCCMAVEPETFTKTDRQKLIASTVMRKRIGTQLELVDALAAAGCAVTQATVSRDIREIGLEKVHDPVGRPRYVAPEGRRRADPGDALRAVLGQFGRQAAVAQ